MRVGELIKILAEEDPNAQVVIVLSRYRHESLRQMKESNRGFFDELNFSGKDRHHGDCGSVVLVADREE